jgi:hypothetical protein
MKYLILLSLTVANLNCSSTSDKNTSDKTKEYMNGQDKLSYDSTVLEIMKKVVDLTSSSDLFGVQEFITLYEHPDMYQSEALAFLANDMYSFDHKSIVIYSMQKSELKGYKEFLGGVIKLFNEHKISESMLGLALSAPINKRYIVIKNYDDEDISKMLKGLRDSSEISFAFRARIDNILSGKAWKGVKNSL